MKISELLAGYEHSAANERIYSLLDGFDIYTSNAEAKLLAKLKTPIRLSQLSEHDQFQVQVMIRKSLITKIGMENPSVVANEKIKPT